MVALDEKTGGVKFGRFTTSEELASSFTKHIKYDLEDLVFFCIGTDRLTGDSYAPLIGTMLKEAGYTNVIGCIDDPVHAVNLDERIKEIPNDRTIIAIDACLGKMNNISTISLNKGQISPGAGVGKKLTKIGDFNIQGVVNISSDFDNLSFKILQNTRLSVVLKMAKETAKAIKVAFPLQNEIINIEDLRKSM